MAVPSPIQSYAKFDALESLTLTHILLDPSLLTFLKRKSQQIVSLFFINCSAAIEGLSENGIAWSDFLRVLRETSPILREFAIVNDSVPLTEQEYYAYSDPTDTYNNEDDSDLINNIRATLETASKRRLFAYVRLDFKLGVPLPNDELNIEMFVQGDDQREYDALMAVVAANRASCGLPIEYPSPSKCIE